MSEHSPGTSDAKGPSGEDEPSGDARLAPAGADPWEGTCPARWLINDVGRYLTGDEASPSEVAGVGRDAVTRAATEVNDLMASAYAAHDVVATELRFTGSAHGARRTVFALSPSPVALMLLCMRLCAAGDEISVLQHTAGRGTTTRSAAWPFGLAVAEQLSRPPESPTVPLPAGLDDLTG